MSVRTVAHWLAGAGLNRRRDTRPHRADQPGQQNDPGPFPGPNDPPGRQEGRTHPTRGTAGGPTDAPIPRRRPPPSGARAPGPATPTCTAPSRPSPTWPVPRPSMTRRPPPKSAFSAAPGLYHDRHLPGSRRQRTRPYIHVTTARSSATTASWPKSASTCTPMPHSSSAATSSLVEPPQLPSPPHRLPQPTRYLVGGPGWSGAGPAAVGMMSCPCPQMIRGRKSPAAAGRW